MSTTAMQGFYETEFNHAMERARPSLTELAGETLREALAANFRILGISARNGTAIRALRDVVSLAVSVPIAVGVGLQMASDTPVAGALGFDSFRHADLPFDSIFASYGFMCAELFKAPLTAGLSYQTISRHHMVDDYLRRMECTLKLADTLLNQLGIAGSTALPAMSATNRGAAMACLGAGEMARHLSTVFTLLNYLIAPARVGLFLHDELARTQHREVPDWMDPLMGLLRFSSSMSDTIRALLSQIGTHCRQGRYALRMAALLESAEYLSLRVRTMQNDAQTSDRVEIALLQLHTLCAIATNDVLDLLARDKVALAEALRGLRGGNPLTICRRIGHNLEPFGVHSSSIYGEGEAGFGLRLQPKQNSWGRVSGQRASWLDHAQFPLRVGYRLTLLLQYFLAKVVRSAGKPCERPLRPYLQG